MKRFLGSTATLLAITVLSKLIGFARELILLESVGIGKQLDLFLVLYGLVTLVTSALGICVVTSLTPIARGYTGQAAAKALMREGFEVGLKTSLVALIATLIYVSFSTPNAGPDAWLIAIIVSGVVPFSLLAEYQVSLLLGRGLPAPVIAGNIIISLPLALALLIFDLGIVNYAVGLVASFALRAAIFCYLLLDKSAEGGAATWPRVELFGKRLWNTLGGGAAMLAVGIIYVTAQMTGRQLGAGEATLIGYGLKVPLFILTSVWFVLGTGYFTDLVTGGSEGVTRKIGRLSAVNGLLLLGCVISILLVKAAPSHLETSHPFANSQILLVLTQSLPYLPIILFVPLIEMVQRLAATRDKHRLVIAMAATVLIAGLASQALSLVTRSIIWVMWSPAIATAAGCISGLFLLRVVIRSPKSEVCS